MNLESFSINIIHWAAFPFEIRDVNHDIAVQTGFYAIDNTLNRTSFYNTLVQNCTYLMHVII